MYFATKFGNIGLSETVNYQLQEMGSKIKMSVFQAIEDEQFYILTHPQYNPVIGLRVKNIIEGKNPDIGIFK